MKLGVIGFGTRLIHIVNNCMRESSPDLRVVAAIDPNESEVRGQLPEAEGKALKFYDTIEAMVAAGGVDAIAVGTHCNLHAPYAIEAAQTGLPLFLEKPVAINMEQAEALEKAFVGSSCKVVVSFPLRASPLCRRVKRLLDEGVIGTPEHVAAQNYVPYGDVYFNSWYRDASVTGGLFLQKATHDFDYLAFCQGSPIVKVAAMRSCGRVFKDASLKTGEDANVGYYEGIGRPETGMNQDSSSTLLEFANGSRGLYTQVFYAKRGAAARGARFSGYRGTLAFDWFANEASVIHHFEPFEDKITVDSKLHHHGGDGVLADNFVEVVKGEADSMSTIWDGLQSVYACLAARESAQTDQFCAVRQLQSLGSKDAISVPRSNLAALSASA